jgi:carbon storage regulator
MLVLTRRSGQSIQIGPDVEVRVVRIEGDRVVLGIAAPRRVAVVRSELIEQVSGEVREASDTRAKLRIMLAPRVTSSGAGSRIAQGADGDGGGPEGDSPGVA